MLNATSVLLSGDTGPDLDVHQTGGSSSDADWLVHLDRKLTSPVELLHVSGERPGEQTGAIHIPREVEEVIVEILEGDPDRPIIGGSLFNPYQTGGSSGDVVPVDTISLNFGRMDDAAPGGNDSIWIDLGFPIQTVPEAASAELLPQYWVIGTELPRVVLNEVLAEYETLSSQAGDTETESHWTVIILPNIEQGNLNAAQLEVSAQGKQSDEPKQLESGNGNVITFSYTYPDENNLFFASYQSTGFTGGVFVAAGDVNGDGVADTFVAIDALPIDRDDLAG